MSDGGHNQQRVVILTALSVEFKEVCAYLPHFKEEIHRGTIYRRGIFSAGKYSWEVLVALTGRGGSAAATETERALSIYQPDLVLFLGVAGGRKDMKHGDIVAATKVYAYESGKAGTTFQARPNVGRSSHRLEQRAEIEANRKDWLKRLGDTLPDPIPKVYVGPIAAGDKVITSDASDIEKLLQERYDDALAVDMESHGFFEAVHRTDSQVDALVIRGISDLMRDKAEADAKNFQEIASRYASAFAFEILAKLDPFDLHSNQPVSSPMILSVPGEPKDTPVEIDIKPLTPSFQKDDYQIAAFRASLQRFYTKIKNEGRIRFADQCQRLINVLVGIDDVVKQYQKHTPSYDYSMKKKFSDILWHINELIEELQTLQGIYRRPVSNQNQSKLRSTHENIRKNLDLLLRDMEQLMH